MLIQGLQADRLGVLFVEGLGAFILGLCQFVLRLIDHQFALRCINLRLVSPRIDFAKDVTRLVLGSFDKRGRHQIPRYTSLDFDRIYGLGPTDVFAKFVTSRTTGPANRNGWRTRRFRFDGGAATTAR